MGGHPVPERAQVELEAFGLETLLFDLLHEQIVLVDTLCAARELHPWMHEVERLADGGVVLYGIA